MIKALIFDFDGLILDTETPDYQAWSEIYQSFSCQLPFDKWVECIGSSAFSFSPYTYLEELLGHPIDPIAIRTKRRARWNELIANQPVLPGVLDYILAAKRLGLKLGLASSSTKEWVMGHLTRINLSTYFDAIRCFDDVNASKPDPTSYLAVLHALQIQSDEAIALEDSPNGVLAAKRACIFCVAVPNGLTLHLNFDNADLKVSSLSAFPLELLIKQIQSSNVSLPLTRPTR